MLGERPPGSFLTAGYSRTRLVPWGIDGGLEGTANYIVVRRKTGQTEGFSMVSNLRVDTDDVIPVVTGNGAVMAIRPDDCAPRCRPISDRAMYHWRVCRRFMATRFLRNSRAKDRVRQTKIFVGI